MPERDLPITGGCVCGEVRYEIDAEPLHAGYCHCTRCQRRSGTAASANLRPAPGSVTIVSGAELIRWWRPERGWEKGFCSNCGSALFSRDPADDDPGGVRMGTLDHHPGVEPSYRQFVAYAAPWEPLPDDGLERFEESRGGHR